MGSKIRHFADDGWAVWIDGDEKSTVYFNEWVNPAGHNYVDVGIRMYGARNASEVNVYIPFKIMEDEIKDLSPMLTDKAILRGLFNNRCDVDPLGEKCIFEVKYGKHLVNIIKLTDDAAKVQKLSLGTLVTIDLTEIRKELTGEELYIIFRIPHKSMDDVFDRKNDVLRNVSKLHETITSPIVTEKYGYAIRINEARLLPAEISNIDTLHQQNLRKALVSISINESYELNDFGCYRIRHLEEDLYEDYAPPGFDCGSAVNYQWVEERETDMKSHFNFYFDISRSAVSKKSLFLYFCIVLTISMVGNTLYGFLCKLFGMIFG